MPDPRLLTRCPRGHGRLLREEDAHGAYLSCLSCGFVREAPAAPDADAHLPLSVWWRAQSA
jgi:hypothetical protein